MESGNKKTALSVHCGSFYKVRCVHATEGDKETRQNAQMQLLK